MMPGIEDFETGIKRCDLSCSDGLDESLCKIRREPPNCDKKSRESREKVGSYHLYTNLRENREGRFKSLEVYLFPASPFLTFKRHGFFFFISQRHELRTWHWFRRFLSTSAKSAHLPGCTCNGLEMFW